MKNDNLQIETLLKQRRIQFLIDYCLLSKGIDTIFSHVREREEEEIRGKGLFIRNLSPALIFSVLSQVNNC